MGIGEGVASDSRPLSALLSQVLVAFTVEFDNEFERRMGEAGYPGARLSLVVWANLLRFVANSPLSVGDLAAQALASVNQVKFQLGCLERWGFVTLQPDSPGPPSREKRPGWGSGRGIRADWMVRLAPRGLTACGIWPALFAGIERRWEKRFGKDAIHCLRQALDDVASQLDVELPHGLPVGWELPVDFPARVTRGRKNIALPTLLSQLTLAFRLEFDRESPAPLGLCANTLRVLGDKPIRMAEIPRLTGGSPETTDIGWQLKPYVIVTPDSTASRGKVARLSTRGILAQQAYYKLIDEIGRRWKTRFGKEAVSQLRESLGELFDRQREGVPLLSEGLVPPGGTVRAGDQAPALGRRDAGAAARQRMRDLVAQTEAFLRDPAGTLPHYPLWDMNRGFGP